MHIVRLRPGSRACEGRVTKLEGIRHPVIVLLLVFIAGDILLQHLLQEVLQRDIDRVQLVILVHLC